MFHDLKNEKYNCQNIHQAPVNEWVKNYLDTYWYYWKLHFIATILSPSTNCLLHWHRGWSFFQLVEKAHLQYFCIHPLYVNSHIAPSYLLLACNHNIVLSGSGWPGNLSTSLRARINTFAIGRDWTIRRYVWSCM